MSNWSATPDAFPLGLAKLSQDTGWKYVAHNRYWSTANVCKVAALPRFPTSRLANPDCVTIADAKQNGGDFEFIIEKGGKAIPTTQRFWDYLMRVSKEWGMAVYEQDWLHNECKIVTLSRFVAVRLANPKSITISGGFRTPRAIQERMRFRWRETRCSMGVASCNSRLYRSWRCCGASTGH